MLTMATLPVHSQDLAKQRELFEHQVKPLVEEYCLDCHSGDSPEGDFDLGHYDAADQVLMDRMVWKKALQRIQFGDMPPPDEIELEKKTRTNFIQHLDDLINKVDCTAGTNPGKVTIRRLNRAEYRNTIQSLIGLDYKPAAGFPGDDVGYGFDNIGDVLSMPPILLEKYLTAAELISRKAIVTKEFQTEFSQTVLGKDMVGDGSPTGLYRILATNGTARYRLPIPKDGQYEIEYTVYGDQAGDEPVKIELISGRTSIRSSSIRAESENPVTLKQKYRFRRGSRSISIRFNNDYWDPDFRDPERRDRNLVIQQITIRGPVDKQRELPATHRQIFFVMPDKDLSEDAAARRILTRLASRAFRRPATAEEINRLMKLVELAKSNGDGFETGIQLALQAILVSPHFLFKVEQPVAANQIRQLNDYELATSLSYFLWSSMPDDELLKTAHGKKLSQSKTIRMQIERMLKDRRSAELVKNFVGQWLQLRNLKDTSIDSEMFPGYSPKLAASMQRETEMFAWELLKNDESILKFLDADFTFLNGPLAKHYGIDVPDLKGKPDGEFVRVSLKGKGRGGLLTHGSILTITSNPTRTSPVKRGRWILENLLNMPPPPPAPDVMELEDQELTGTLRERMKQHRENPSCASCHAQMDPLGFAMERFDPVGRYREKDQNVAIDASGELPGGERFDGVIELQKLLIQRKKDQFVRCLVEKMLTFALGRGIEYFDRCAVDKIMEHLEKTDYRFSELIYAIAISEPFQKRKGTPNE